MRSDLGNLLKALGRLDEAKVSMVSHNSKQPSIKNIGSSIFDRTLLTAQFPVSVCLGNTLVTSLVFVIR